MKSHTIRPTQTQFGFIIDDEIVIAKGNNYNTIAIHLNKGPKKAEEYINYSIDGRSFQDVNPSEIMCNERLYIDINFSFNEPYIRGFIANFLESDLDYIQKEGISDILGIFSLSDMCSIKRKNSTQDIEDYLKQVFGDFWSKYVPSYIQQYCGIQLFKKKIYLDTYDRTFGIDLSDIPLKDEFDQLIKANVDKIKQILFPNNIPEDLKYSIY